MSYELNAGGKQLAEVIEKVTWSGDSKQVARKLVFTVANKDSERFLPKVNINEGDQVQFLEDGKLLFSGPVFDIEKSGSGNVVTYTAFDLMFYVTKSDINRVFDNETPEAITSWICSHLGIPFGAAASTGIPVYMPWLGKKAYDGIMAAYTAASRKNGKKYIPLIKNATQLYVIERGALCGVVLDGSYNLTEANYKTSLQNMVDRVLITDKDGNQIGVVEDTAAQQKYGVVQTVYKQEDGKDAQTEAKALLQTLEQTGSVTGCQGDSRAVSGYALIVQETTTGLFGKFYIESDTHTFTDGKHEMALTLAFSNMMDEKEIENQSQG